MLRAAVRTAARRVAACAWMTGSGSAPRRETRACAGSCAKQPEFTPVILYLRRTCDPLVSDRHTGFARAASAKSLRQRRFSAVRRPGARSYRLPAWLAAPAPSGSLLFGQLGALRRHKHREQGGWFRAARVFADGVDAAIGFEKSFSRLVDPGRSSGRVL